MKGSVTWMGSAPKHQNPNPPPLLQALSAAMPRAHLQFSLRLDKVIVHPRSRKTFAPVHRALVIRQRRVQLCVLSLHCSAGEAARYPGSLQAPPCTAGAELPLLATGGAETEQESRPGQAAGTPAALRAVQGTGSRTE